MNLPLLPVELGPWPATQPVGTENICFLVSIENESKLGATGFGAGEECIRHWLLFTCLYIRDLHFHAFVCPGFGCLHML